MEGVEAIISLVTGEAGALVVLVLITVAWVRGHLYNKSTIDALEKEHDEYAKQAAAQTEATENLAKAVGEALEASKLTLDILEKARRSAHDKEA